MFRVATNQERERYEAVLYPLQDRVLSVANVLGPDLVLTGGTALSRLYLHHRLSDDLDLFTAGGNIPSIAQFLASELEGIQIETVSPSFGRLFFGPAEALKIEIVRDDVRLEEPARFSSPATFAHTLRDIGANRISAFEDRAATKDAIDL